MSDAEILFANDAFYAAFARADVAEMRAAWAENHPVSCLHPGWQPLIGHDAVMESWSGILGSAESHPITCRDATVQKLKGAAGQTAYVLCYEVLEGSVMAATNIFVQENNRWRMVHHQAAPTRGLPRRTDDEPPSVLQ